MSIKLNEVEKLLYSQMREYHRDDNRAFEADVEGRREFINTILRALIASEGAKKDIGEVALKQFVALHPEANEEILGKLFMEDSDSGPNTGGAKYEYEVHDSVLSNFRIFSKSDTPIQTPPKEVLEKLSKTADNGTNQELDQAEQSLTRLEKRISILEDKLK